jgi:hypothetical protein
LGGREGLFSSLWNPHSLGSWCVRLMKVALDKYRIVLCSLEPPHSIVINSCMNPLRVELWSCLNHLCMKSVQCIWRVHRPVLTSLTTSVKKIKTVVRDCDWTQRDAPQKVKVKKLFKGEKVVAFTKNAEDYEVLGMTV